MKRTVIATISMLVSSTGFCTEALEDRAHYSGRQVGVYYSGSARPPAAPVTPGGSSRSDSTGSVADGPRGHRGEGEDGAIWGANSRAEREAHALAAQEGPGEVRDQVSGEVSDEAGDGRRAGPASHARPHAVGKASDRAGHDQAERLAVSTLAMHAARVMGAQTSRLVGLDSLEPTVEVPDTRPARAAARPAAAGWPGEGKASREAGPRPRHAELMPAAGSIGPALASAYDELIEEVAARHRVAPHLVRAVIKVESNFQPQARSPKGAMGLMQVMPATGKRFGAADLRDPRENVNAGTRYLRWLLDRFDDDLSLTLAAYNAGEGAVERHGRRIPPYAETQGYVTKVLGHLGMASSARAAESAAATGAAAAMAAPAPTKRFAERQLASGPPAASREAVRALHTVSGWIGALLTSGSRRPAEERAGGADGQMLLPVADRDADGFERPDGGTGAGWTGNGDGFDGRKGLDGSARPV